MNEQIMRRGLTPEGCRIREKYQGSLLNDEFGVTSKPIHKIIEKDFLKENVMRLKEIQAKCRTQESKPRSGNQPVKAIRSSNIDLSFAENTEDMGVTSEKKINHHREGSAHSDYFSLPDDSQNLHDSSNFHSSPSLNISKIYDRDKYTTKISTLSQNKFLDEKNKTYSNLRGTFINRKFDPAFLNFHISQRPGDDCYSKSPLSKHNKVCKVIEKIKSKPPACETNTEFIWRDIRKEHRTLFPKNDCFSVSVLHTAQEELPLSKNFNFPDKTSSLVRSRSLDRNSINRARLLRNQNCDSLYTLEPLYKSSSTNKLLNISHNSGKLQNSSEKLMLRSANLSDGSVTLNSSHNINSENPVDSETSGVSVNSSKFIDKSSEHLSTGNLVLKDDCSNNDAIVSTASNLLGANCTSKHCIPLLEKELFCNQSENIGRNYPSSNSSGTYESVSTIKERHDLMNEQIQVEKEPVSLPDSTSASDSKQEVLDCLQDKNTWEKRKGSSIPNLSSIDKNENGKQMEITRNSLNEQNVQTNVSRRHGSPLFRSKSSTSLHIAGKAPPSYKRGQIPKYLKIRKAETQRRLEAAAAVDPLCPPGHSPVPDSERRNTLHLLKKAQVDVMRQLSALPLAQDTLRVRKLKHELEIKLNQIEEGIGIFSQNKVYVLNDE